MVLKNEDINLLIKMENLIGMNEKRLFGKNKDKKCTVNWYDNATTTIDFDDFISFMDLIERALQDKQKASDKVAQYHKDNAEKHREYNREWARKNYQKKKKGVK
jgi:hypothetical protein